MQCETAHTTVTRPEIDDNKPRHCPIRKSSANMGGRGKEIATDTIATSKAQIAQQQAKQFKSAAALVELVVEVAANLVACLVLKFATRLLLGCHRCVFLHLRAQNVLALALGLALEQQL